MFPGLPPARRRLRAVRHRLGRRRRPIAAVLLAGSLLAGLRVVAPPAPATVPVLVAARDLPSGATLGRGDLTTRLFPADLAPAAASTTGAGRVLAAPLAAGEVLTDVRVVGPGLAEIEPGRTVLPVRLPDAGMAALLAPGDVVDLVATDPGSGESRVVGHDVDVLAGAAEVPEGPTGSGGALVVVGVDDDEAVAVSSAALAQFLTVSWNR
ncbi:SAF domain-containing protein [Nocardioides zeicaulis]|uniref:SAF domain-containing protein n=1 Tax=Nocardioides zeicaulis TaxID=1776857 RepID=A0ABV6DZM8_9ACTN